MSDPPSHVSEAFPRLMYYLLLALSASGVVIVVCYTRKKCVVNGVVLDTAV